MERAPCVCWFCPALSFCFKCVSFGLHAQYADHQQPYPGLKKYDVKLQHNLERPAAP